MAGAAAAVAAVEVEVETKAAVTERMKRARGRAHNGLALPLLESNKPRELHLLSRQR